jgi:hypothetical protein
MPLPTRYTRPPSGRAAMARAAGAAGLMILAGCAAASPHLASGPRAQPGHVTARPAASRGPAAVPPASRPAAASSPATGATRSAATGYAGPHFTTPRAAMAYLAAAYNTDDTAAMHELTDPQAFTSLQAMRSFDADLQLTSCTPTPRGDYMCSVRYDDPERGHHSRHQTAMLIAAPALNPGWYMYRFVSGCD